MASTEPPLWRRVARIATIYGGLVIVAYGIRVHAMMSVGSAAPVLAWQRLATAAAEALLGTVEWAPWAQGWWLVPWIAALSLLYGLAIGAAAHGLRSRLKAGRRTD